MECKVSAPDGGIRVVCCFIPHSLLSLSLFLLLLLVVRFVSSVLEVLLESHSLSLFSCGCGSHTLPLPVFFPPAIMTYLCCYHHRLQERNSFSLKQSISDECLQRRSCGLNSIISLHLHQPMNLIN